MSDTSRENAVYYTLASSDAKRTDTPETDKWTGLRHDIRELACASRRLERQRDAYAETLRGIFALCRDYEKLNADRLEQVIDQRHPELAKEAREP